MKYGWFALALTFFVPGLARAGNDTERLESLLTRVDDLWRGAQSEAVLSMRVKTKHYERTIKMRAWSKGKEHSLVVILAPRKEKGSATLKAEAAVYTYLPKTRRTIRLGAGMMGSAWMGSHFTNDDLVKESRLFDDYDAKLVFEGKRNGQHQIEVELVPKPQAPVVWGKVRLDIDAETQLPLRQRYYDEDQRLARTLTFHDVRSFGDRTMPGRLLVVPAHSPEELTEVVYEAIDFEVSLKDSFFSLRQLERARR